MQLSLRDVSKKIKENYVLKHVNLTLENGNVYGFIGKNGSGKTMLFRTIAGLIQVSDGSILWDGKELCHKTVTAPKVGILLENSGLYPELTGVANLQLLANINKRITKEEIYQAIKRVGLKTDDKRTYGKYSLGMKQRILIAQAIMEQPDILILDEPTNALDDEGKELLRKIVMEEKARGALVLIASHDKNELEMLVDKSFVVSNGVVKEG